MGEKDALGIQSDHPLDGGPGLGPAKSQGGGEGKGAPELATASTALAELVHRCAAAPSYAVRELAARALSPLVSPGAATCAMLQALLHRIVADSERNDDYHRYERGGW